MKKFLLCLSLSGLFLAGHAQAPKISYASPQTFTAGVAITPLAPVNTGGAVPATVPWTVTTLAGSTASGSTDGTGTEARFNHPWGIAVNTRGNIYVADGDNNMIREITPDGTVTTIAGSTTSGSADGAGTEARFFNPKGLAVDVSGNLYIADGSNYMIRKMTPDGIVTTLAGSIIPGSINGKGAFAHFRFPIGLTVNALGNVYVADYSNHMIRKITSDGVVTTLSGSTTPGSTNGTVTSASFHYPSDVVVDSSDNVYVADQDNNMIRKITPDGVVSTLAGNSEQGSSNGMGTDAQFYAPTSISVDGSNNIYVADQSNNMIRKVTKNGIVTTLAGRTVGSKNGTGIAASFNCPTGVAVDASGCLYVADASNNMIRKITPYGYSISPSLPKGLNFDETTGIISGTPVTGSASADYTITGTNSGGSSSATVNITIIGQPTVSTQKVTSIDTTSATVNGNIDNLGAPDPIQYGVIWSTEPAPTIALTTKTEQGAISTIGSFKSAMTGLIPNTKYYVRAYATNNEGTSYGNEVLFYTKNIAPNISYASKQTYTVGITIAPSAPVNTGGPVPALVPWTVTTLAGSTISGSADGIGTEARFAHPNGVAVDAAGNVYVADLWNHMIRKINSEGKVTTLAGNGTPGSTNGMGTTTSIYYPEGIAVDASGYIYVADEGNNMIWKITPDGLNTILAGNNIIGSTNGTGTEASFNNPYGIAVDTWGNVYVADAGNNMIRKITPDGVVSTLAGSKIHGSTDGTGSKASFNIPSGVAADESGNIYVADNGNNIIRKITSDGVVATFAQNGFYKPTSLAVDGSGKVYVANTGNNIIQEITPDGIITTLVGNKSSGSANGVGTAASFKYPTGVAVDASGCLYVADTDNNMIRKITPYGYSISPSLPKGLNFDGTSGIISGTPEVRSASADYIITGTNSGGRSTTKINITVVEMPTVTTLNPTDIGTMTITANGNISDLGTSNPTQYGVAWSTKHNPSVGLSTKTELGTISTTGIFKSTISGLTPNTRYYVRAYATNSIGTSYGDEIMFYTKNSAPIIKYTTPQTYTAGVTITPLVPVNTGGTVPATVPGTVTTIAGSTIPGATDGTGTGASFYYPAGITVDALGNMYVADCSNHMIRKITPEGLVTTLAGGSWGSDNGTGTLASFHYPTGVAVNASGKVFVADQGTTLIRQITPQGEVTTLAGNSTRGSANGTGTAASFYYPAGVAVDPSGNLYVADSHNHMIRKITSSGVVTTLAGSIYSGSSDGTGTTAGFNLPSGVTADASGNVFVADQRNNLIRKITPGGTVTTLAGNTTSGSADGTGTAASFNWPTSLAVDVAGNLYVADEGNNMIREISPDGMVTTLAGSTTSGSADGIGSAAGFNSPEGVAVDTSGIVYVADYGNNLIRKINPFGYSISPSLPEGLNFDGTNGIISGTPTAGSPSTNYTITGSNNGGYSTTTVNITITGPASIPELTDKGALTGYVIYPNPATDYLIIKSPNAGVDQIQIFDLSGHLVMESKIQRERIDIKKLIPGMYILKIDHCQYKFIKQ